MAEIAEVIARWDSGEGKPYKGSLIDWQDYQSDPDSIGCMCAQGQVLHLAGGWSPAKLRDTDQSDADKETASLLRISRAHAVLLRNVNDKADGAPSVVLTDPGKVLGNRWSTLLDLWWAFDQFSVKEWAAARDAAGDAAWDAARAAARDAARDAAGAAARDAAGDAARAAAGDAAWVAAGAAAWVAVEVQGEAILFDQSKPLFFLPAFGFSSTKDIPPRPADYGLGVVPAGDAA